MRRAVTSSLDEMDRVVHLATAPGDVYGVARLVRAGVHLEGPAAHRQHLWHEGQGVEIATLVQGRQDLPGGSHAYPVTASPRRRRRSRRVLRSLRRWYSHQPTLTCTIPAPPRSVL